MTENKKEDLDVIIFTSKYSTLNLQSRSFSIFGRYNYMYIHDFHELLNNIDETLKSKRFVTVIIDCDNLITLTDVNIIRAFFNVHVPNSLLKDSYSAFNENHTVWAYIISAIKQHYGERILLALNSCVTKEKLFQTITCVSDELSNNIEFIQEPAFVKEYNACVDKMIRKFNKSKQIIYKTNIAKYSILFKINKNNNKVKYG